MFKDDFHALKSTDSVGRSLEKSFHRRENPELCEKWEKARVAVLSPEELKAILNMTHPTFFLENQAVYMKPHEGAWERNRNLPPPWIQKTIDQGGEKKWGYTIYCASARSEGEDETQIWDEFYENFRDWVSIIPGSATGSHEILHSKVIEFVHTDVQDDDVDRLREMFRTHREQGNLKPGVLSHVFLWVTKECRDSYRAALYPWLWAIDPDWSLPGADEDGYDGRLKLSWGQAYFKFYDFMSMNKHTLKEIWQDYNQVCQQQGEPPAPGWGFTKLDRPSWPAW